MRPNLYNRKNGKARSAIKNGLKLQVQDQKTES